MISIIIPCFNEENTIAAILNKVLMADTLGFKKQIIVVNDGSSDQSLMEMKKFLPEIQILNFQKNHGKGHSVRAALETCEGQYILIQDADLEYDPADYSKLLKEIIKNDAMVVYGARNREHLSFKTRMTLFYAGGIILTKMANFLYRSKLTDIHTCYKLFNADAIRGVAFKSNRFEICHEMTAYFLNNKIQIKEVPITYFPRAFSEGKKIRWQDGVHGAWTLIGNKFTGQKRKRP